MLNFEYKNTTKIIFGKGQISQLEKLIGKDEKILMVYGGGSIKNNGTYEQVTSALKDNKIIEFSGIEANPTIETCRKAIDLCRVEGVTFILAVGGGSVIDASKLIAAGFYHEGDAWDLFKTRGADIKKALPIATVLTLPATGSESNGTSVVSKKETNEKMPLASEFTYPKFSILDPETTYSLPEKQVQNGIVDTYIHVCEQYITDYNDSYLQDYMCEAVLKNLVDNGLDILNQPKNYNLRATFMHSANIALNGSLSEGGARDFATHMIGHELTAFLGLDHALTLAIIQPAVYKFLIEQKRQKLERYGLNVFGVDTAEEAIDKTEEFYKSLGMKTRLRDCGFSMEEVKSVAEKIKSRFEERGTILGEQQNITPGMVYDMIISRA